MVLPNTLDNWDIACKCCGGNEFTSRDEILTMPKSSEDEVRQRFGYDEFNAEELLKKRQKATSLALGNGLAIDERTTQPVIKDINH